MSPPSQRRRVDDPSSPPLPSEMPLFSSPGGQRAAAMTSEIDLSSPLNYGTPSSRFAGTPRTPGAAGTPIRPRPDVRSERRMRTVNLDGAVSTWGTFQ